jgi:hypothetical protein
MHMYPHCIGMCAIGAFTTLAVVKEVLPSERGGGRSGGCGPTATVVVTRGLNHLCTFSQEIFYEKAQKRRTIGGTAQGTKAPGSRLRLWDSSTGLKTDLLMRFRTSFHRVPRSESPMSRHKAPRGSLRAPTLPQARAPEWRPLGASHLSILQTIPCRIPRDRSSEVNKEQEFLLSQGLLENFSLSYAYPTKLALGTQARVHYDLQHSYLKGPPLPLQRQNKKKGGPTQGLLSTAGPQLFFPPV